jgi:tetratricopeptide (TPR) repeat protein
MNNLGMGLYELNNLEAALRIHKETLAMNQAKFGRDDRGTLRTMINLANVYYALVRYDDALALREKTVELFSAKYGRDDADALMAMHNLADCYRDFGRYADAFRLDEEARSRRKTVLGVDHPDTLASLWSLAHDLIKLHRDAEAIPLIDECLERAVGKRVHPFFRQVADLRLRHFEKAKDAAGCRTTAELWEKQARNDAASFYQAAVNRAVSAAVVKAASPSRPGTDRLANDQADLAMTWLQKAVAAGFDEKDILTACKDFDSLRDRADFRKLLAELEAKQR